MIRLIITLWNLGIIHTDDYVRLHMIGPSRMTPTAINSSIQVFSTIDHPIPVQLPLILLYSFYTSSLHLYLSVPQLHPLPSSSDLDQSLSLGQRTTDSASLLHLRLSIPRI